jgi:uncharacterized protein YaiI (UPF0178 family)
MQIIVDADACPKVIKEFLYRASQRTGAPSDYNKKQPCGLDLRSRFHYLIQNPGVRITSA